LDGATGASVNASALLAVVAFAATVIPACGAAKADLMVDLFGFDRVLDLLRTSQTAEQVASAAQNFGQDDDISVISITRSVSLEPALT
jgi:hypothetical protein